MAVEFQITGEKMLETLKARAVRARPCISHALTFQGELYQLAWFEIGDGEFQIATEATSLALNTLVEGKVAVPEEGALMVTLHRLQLKQPVTAHLCTRAAMKLSNNDQAPTLPVDLEVILDLVMDVNTQGVARLCTIAVDAEVPGIALSPQDHAALNQFVLPRLNTCYGISLNALARFPGAEVPRVINAGIAATPDLGAISLRFELDEPDTGALTRWENYFNGVFQDLLFGGDWGMLIPKQIIEPSVEKVIADNLAGKPDFSLLTSVSTTWSPLGNIPRLFVVFTGEIIDACIGIDMNVDVTLDVRFTVPQNNTLRNTVVLGYDTYFGEEFLCVFTTALLFPIVGLAMIAEGKLEWGEYFAGVAGGPLAVLIKSIQFMLSDEPAGQVPSPPNYVKDSDVQWHQDMPFPDSFGGVSGMNLTLAGGVPEGLVLVGSINLTPVTVPALKTFPHPFVWQLSKPCKSMFDYQAEASIGVIADPLGAQPRNPLRICDVEIINDPEGRYVDNDLPPDGQVNSSVELRFRVKGRPPGAPAGEDFGQANGSPPIVVVDEPTYSSNELEVLIFSNQGCRLISIPAPPPLPATPSDPQAKLLQKSAWEAWKVTHCHKLTSIWDHLHIANPEWVIDPPPERLWAQNWWVEASGNTPGEVVTLIDGLGRELMSAVAGADGRAELTAFIEEPAARDSVWLSRDGARMSAVEYRDRVAGLSLPETTVARQLTVIQVQLARLADIALRAPASDVVMDYLRGRPVAYVRVGQDLLGFDLSDPHQPEPVSVSPGVRARLDRAQASSAHLVRRRCASWRVDEGCSGRILDYSDPERPCEIANFRGRPWYVGGARLAGLYVRLDDPGSRLRVFRIGESRSALDLPTRPEEVFPGWGEEDAKGIAERRAL